MSAKSTHDHSHSFDVIIIGGGPAGLTSAIHLSKHDISVMVIEKHAYPMHKVCGEYVSNEVLPYLQYLGIDPMALGAKKIIHFELSTLQSNLIRASLPLGGFSISRYKFDEILAEKAVGSGVDVLHDEVINVQFSHDEFKIITKKNKVYTSRMAIGAYGKRSSLDARLKRNFIGKNSPFLAIKVHASGDFSDNLVALHNFQGGYCGVSKVEDDSINLCYITTYQSFKKYKDVRDFQEQVVLKNTHLKTIFERSEPVFQPPLTIGQISFATKGPVEKHVLMCGDTAGMIHPLCGNGMSMAIRSAQMVSEIIIKYVGNEIRSRADLEKAYREGWNKEFRNRLIIGRLIASLFNQMLLAEVLMWFLKQFPGLLPKIIKLTHGKPMVAK